MCARCAPSWTRRRGTRIRDGAGWWRRSVRRARGRGDHENEQHPLRRHRQPDRVGRTRRHQPRPHPSAHAARLSLRARSVEPAVLLDRRQPRQQLGRAALPRVRRHERPHRRGRGRAGRRFSGDARRSHGRAGGVRPAGRLRRKRGHHGHRHQDRGAPHSKSAGTVHDAARLRHGARRSHGGERHHCGGRGSRGDRDDGRGHHPRRRAIRRCGLSHRRGCCAAGRGRRARR